MVGGTMLLPAQRNAIVLPVHIALDAVTTGDGEIKHRHTIAAFLNIASVCAARMPGVDERTRAALDAAKQALISLDHRYIKTHRWGFSGPEMQTMNHAITIADTLFKRVHSGTMVWAVAFVGAMNAKSPEVLGTCDEPMKQEDYEYA